jgi:hypothetical protein
MTDTDIHSCGYYCDRPLCIKAQRDELRNKMFSDQAVKTYSGGKPNYTQPIEQEPAAWMHTQIEGNVITHEPTIDLKRHPERWKPLYADPTPCKTCEALARTVMMDQTSHDTKKEWVGLTSEELEFYTEELGQGELGRGVLRAVDDFLKEKNT